MRLEGKHRSRAMRRLRTLDRSCDQRAVAAMHAVEIADGDDRPRQSIEACPIGLRTAVAHDDEWTLADFGHDE
jgi:hypothetical protein